MVIVSSLSLPTFWALLTDTSRTQSLENIPSSRRAQRALHDQDLHHPRVEAAGFPRAAPQWHGACD